MADSTGAGAIPNEASSEQTRPLVLSIASQDRQRRLADLGIHAVQARPAGLVECVGHHSPDLVLLCRTGFANDDELFQACEALSTSKTFTQIPILVLASSDQLAERAIASGASDVVMQSASVRVVKRRIEFMIEAGQAFGELKHSAVTIDRIENVARLGTWNWSLGSKSIRISTRLARLLGHDAEQGNASVRTLLKAIHADDRYFVERQIDRARQSGDHSSFDHRIVGVGGRETVIHHELSGLRNGSGEVTSLLGVVQDVTDMRAAQERIRLLANYDPLTGLPNRISFLELLSREVDRADHEESGSALLLLDIDHFKQTNESLGQQMGDRMLKAISDRLLGCLRRGDLVARDEGKLEALARRGGDEFFVLLTGMDQVHHAGVVASRIMELFRHPFPLNQQEHYVTASVGVALLSANKSANDLVKEAEIAMYDAKSNGRNCFRFFDASMNEKVVARFALERGLRRAVRQHELALYYQPIVSTADRRVVGVEALLRWKHPVEGTLSADRFIRIAEETGLIIPIGRWALKLACQQIGSWSRRSGHPLILSFNLSPQELRSRGFEKYLGAVLTETEFDPAQLEFEITERGVMRNDRDLELLLQLREKGVRFAVDDFGTGNAALTYLRDFPVSTLKIDKSFTQGITHNDKDAAITKAVLAMAQRLQLNVVAEGVETEAQFDFLADNRCSNVQGYLFGRPEPVPRLAGILGLSELTEIPAAAEMPDIPEIKDSACRCSQASRAPKQGPPWAQTIQHVCVSPEN